MRKGTGTERTHGPPCSRSHAWGGNSTPLEENADLPGFAPESAHLLLQGVYGDFPHHNDGLHLNRRIADDAAWQRHWRARCLVSELVCHALWCSRAPIYGYLGRGMTGGYR